MLSCPIDSEGQVQCMSSKEQPASVDVIHLYFHMRLCHNACPIDLNMMGNHFPLFISYSFSVMFCLFYDLFSFQCAVHLVAYYTWCRRHRWKMILNRERNFRLSLWIWVKDVLRNCVTLVYHLCLPWTCSGFGGSTDLLHSMLARFLSVFLTLSSVQCIIFSSGFYYCIFIF